MNCLRVLTRLVLPTPEDPRTKTTPLSMSAVNPDLITALMKLRMSKLVERLFKGIGEIDFSLLDRLGKRILRIMTATPFCIPCKSPKASLTSDVPKISFMMLVSAADW